MLMTHFTLEGITDVGLPFDHRTLPDFVRGQELRQRFLDLQERVISEAHDVETGNLEHVHFSGSGDEHYERQRDLGSGSYGSVDEVWSKLSLRCFARKRVHRGKDSDITRQELVTAATEIKTLKKLNHLHLVTIAGSYTDPKFIAYLMEPVAEMNLEQYLERLSTRAETLPASAEVSTKYFFGCLAEAMHYLYQSNVRHRDMKPRNILVKGNRVYIADFGSAFDFESSGCSTTQHLRVPATQAFWSPEHANGQPRSYKSEMWSLGLIYLHIISVLKGSSPGDWQKFLARKARKAKRLPFAYLNAPAIAAWLGVLSSKIDGRSANEALVWTRDLLQLKPDMRPSTLSLVKDIMDSPFSKDFCCLECRKSFKTLVISIVARKIQSVHGLAIVCPSRMQFSVSLRGTQAWQSAIQGHN
ncbi:hypothetical protein LTR97_003449 [Elasticomyces elasticus]|uniref:Protein kinase domain-containing protein n=1 Tax=Elasticomyces elasticus TaxID=574655 RepID=A0AAN7VUR9_9PEZI|nr:hypothetical protein LTR97_003449 [Elasticomyces elasticus]